MKTHVLTIPPAKHFLRKVHLDEENELEVQVTSTDLVDIMLLTDCQYDKLYKEETKTTFYGVEQQNHAKLTFKADHKGTYCFVVDNQGQESVEVNIVVAKTVYL